MALIDKVAEQQKKTDALYEKYIDAMCSDWSYRNVAVLDRELALEIEKLRELKAEFVRLPKEKTKTRKR